LEYRLQPESEDRLKAELQLRISPAHMLQKTYQTRNNPPERGGRGLYQENSCCIASRAAKRFRTLGLSGAAKNEEPEKLYQARGAGGVIGGVAPNAGNDFLVSRLPVCARPGQARQSLAVEVPR
jgi:hypothetical protein